MTFRPQVSKNKIHYRNDFESCYIRHRYIRKVDYNPEPHEMTPYFRIINKQSSQTFSTYSHLFNLVGFTVEDIISIGRVHLVSFLGLFALEKSNKKMDSFISKFNQINSSLPTSDDILDKNKANFTMFLKQRMEDMVRLCKLKGANIKGRKLNDVAPFKGTTTPPGDEALLTDCHKHGFTKVDIAVFKRIRKNSHNGTSLRFKHEDTWYVAIPLDQTNLNSMDMSSSDMDPYLNAHNMDPETLIKKAENDDIWSKRQQEFDDKSKKDKIKTIRKFITKNRNRPNMKKDINLAKKVLTLINKQD